jgi:hypothetical protein
LEINSMAGLDELKANAAAFQSWTDHMLEAMGKGFFENFIPQSAFMTAATDVVGAVEKSADQSTSGRQAAAARALRAALDSTGQGGQVSDDQCFAGAAAILVADAAWKVAHKV